ncbi:actinia tenebrosa protease inhibitors-like isoform X1 [Bombyx mori]|uniref:actinia tenebrosa protease inhibitors-like isoform X1 n=1 Tax=Bombyx mori TaxID=7091 RepID=UPI002ED68CC9
MCEIIISKFHLMSQFLILEASEEDISSHDWTVLCKFQANRFDCTNGKELYRKFYYDLKMEDCKTFNFGQCPNSMNHFDTLDDCQSTCRDRGLRPIDYNISAKIYCQLQPDFGECNSYYPMWYFDVSHRTCHGFSYSGCGGNKNRFPDSQTCSTTCITALHLYSTFS